MSGSASPEPAQPAVPRRHWRPLGEEAADHIRDMILSGESRSGEFLRPEIIAAGLGMSATPAREGLLALQAEGFVRQVPQRGFMVNALSADDIRDLFAVRALIAGELAARSAVVMSDTTAAALREIRDQMRTAAANGSVSDVSDRVAEFQDVVSSTASAPKIKWYFTISAKVALERFYPRDAEWVSIVVAAHERILTAFEARDPDGARAAVAAHVMESGELLAQSLSKSAPGG